MFYRNTSQDEVASLVRTGATKLSAVHVKQRGPTAPILYLQIYDNAAPTVGTTTPALALEIPAGETGQHQNRKYIIEGSKGGMNMATALSIACTTTPGGPTGPASADRPEVKIKLEVRP